MTDRKRLLADDRSRDTLADGFRRRPFAALGEGVTATVSVVNGRRRCVGITCS